MNTNWTEAIARFRRAAGVDGYSDIEDAPAHRANALFIACSEAPELATLIGSLDPACIMLTLGGIVPSASDARQHLSAATTIDDAIERLDVGQIVLCGHAGCRAADDSADAGDLMKALGIGADASQRHLLAQRRRLEQYVQSQVNGRKPNDLNVGLLWFDPVEGEIFSYSSARQTFFRMSDLDLEQWVAELHAPITELPGLFHAPDDTSEG